MFVLTAVYFEPRSVSPAPFPVDVQQVSDQGWKTPRTLTYHATTEDFEVPAHQGTDFASVPRVFVWFIPRYGRYTKAAILHDYLCRQYVPSGRISRIDADGIFRQAMRELGVPFLRRWIMWAASGSTRDPQTAGPAHEEGQQADTSLAALGHRQPAVHRRTPTGSERRQFPAATMSSAARQLCADAPVRASLLRADDAAGHARNPYLAVFFVGADLGDDGFRDPLPGRFVDLLKRRNCERDVLADHLPILRG